MIDAGVGTQYARGAEIGRFNMGSTVIVLFGKTATFMPRIQLGEPVRLGQPLARFA
jgi:phosphatidylserine decarboxylase